ncbi:pyridoxal phosphate-dependent transferase [Mariannaea sp. PMI_226]|nr:pyridoxal phosphate-dependent transferase [Mariannaea sp. PMI_226]
MASSLNRFVSRNAHHRLKQFSVAFPHQVPNPSYDRRCLSTLYAKLDTAPQTIIGSRGSYLQTQNGSWVIDASAGASVVSVGHKDPRVKQAIVDQLDQVAFTYNPFFTTPAVENLAQFLTDSTNGEMSKVFFVSSGTEAVESALKIARQYFTELPTPQLTRTRFIGRKQSYHGNTLGSLATGYHAARRKIYEPILSSNVSHVSPCYAYRDMKPGETDEAYVSRLADELDREFQAVGPETVCAFVAETVSGTSLGCVPPVRGYFKAMKQVCDRYGALLIMDEVMSGMGRCGTLHAWEEEGVVPDLQTVAKGLGSGYLPIGALLVNKRVADTLAQGTGAFVHSQTYQAHPVACAAAYAVQQIMRDDNLLENTRETGTYLSKLLRQRLGGHKNVGDIRGRGLFWAVEFVRDKATKEPFPPGDKLAARIHQTGLKPEHGISVIPASGNINGVDGDLAIISPPLNVTKEEIEVIVDKLDAVLSAVLGK